MQQIYFGRCFFSKSLHIKNSDVLIFVTRIVFEGNSFKSQPINFGDNNPLFKSFSYFYAVHAKAMMMMKVSKNRNVEKIVYMNTNLFYYGCFSNLY